MIKRLFLLLLLVTSYGCTSELKSQMQGLMGSKISLDLTLKEYPAMQDKNLSWLSDSASFRLVILCDSTECASCRVKMLERYNEIYELKDSQGRALVPIIIFSPAISQQTELIENLQKQALPYQLYIDYNHEFIKANPSIPSRRELHAFLLNKVNEVVLIGDPVNNPVLWDLYQTVLKDS